MKRDEPRKDRSGRPAAQRSGRHGVDPASQPGEFTDDMRVNRFTPPPEPDESREKKKD